MANTYFRFKQFTVRQDRCAMKVSTDACVFGAWVAGITEGRFPPAAGQSGISAAGGGQGAAPDSRRGLALDVGTGTGLLALMVAQTSDFSVTCVEIDPDAAAQASENFASSPWADRLQVVQGDINVVGLPGPFDLILSNPPFFDNDLRGPDPTRNLARHGDSLNLSQLIEIFARNLAPEGLAAVILPFFREGAFLAEALGRGLHCTARLRLRLSPAHQPYRSLLLLRNVAGPERVSELSIRDGDRYSAEFAGLLRPYYLHL